MSSRKSKRRLRQLRRQLRRLRRQWDKANREHGYPPRPAIDAHHKKVMALIDEIDELSRA